MVEYEKRHMRLQLQHVLEEQVAEIYTLVPTRETSKMKPTYGHHSNSGYGPYEEDDACAFCKHLQEAHHMLVDKSGWLEHTMSD